MLNEEQIHENWKRFREIVNTEFVGERKDKLNKMYDHFEERAVIAPASGKEHFHNAFPGGYIDHVLRVIDFAVEDAEKWEKRGTMINFTREEVIFSAMHHDLYKLGDLDEDYYVPNDSQWHREKQGAIYKFNDKLTNTDSDGQTFFILAQFQIPYTKNEYVGIKCTDGMYAESSEYILKQHDASKQLRTNLVFILHHADMCASRFEYDKWMKNKTITNPLGVSRKNDEGEVMFKKQNIGKMAKIIEKNTTDTQKKIFEDLFK